jgi:hypothetical protein
MQVFLDVLDREGKVLQSFKPNSFVAGWITLLARSFGAARDLTQNAGQSTQAQWRDFEAVSGEGGTTRGVVVGTGTTPVNVDDTQLDVQIEHGDGPGQLLYAAQSISLLTIGNEDLVSLDRTFENATDTEITIREVGLFCRYEPTNNANENLLVERTVLTTPIAVADSGGTVTVRYRIMA